MCSWWNLLLRLLHPGFRWINDLILPPPIQWICSQHWCLIMSLPPTLPALVFLFFFTISELDWNCFVSLSATCVIAHGCCLQQGCVGIIQGAVWKWDAGKAKNKETGRVLRRWAVRCDGGWHHGFRTKLLWLPLPYLKFASTTWVLQLSVKRLNILERGQEILNFLNIVAVKACADGYVSVNLS